ncbi:hypothetical protein HY251_20245 [bacterium]|nr:hypothetical protein [bacterium]
MGLRPGSRIGAVPLVSPATRRVVAGVLVEPRYRWAALGAVFGATGFEAEPSVGGARLVPGSAREVPPWILAAPVVRRLEELLARSRRSFVEKVEERTSPRGRVDWSDWARHSVPLGRWTRLTCHFTEPTDDPALMAAVRWTLGRLGDELAPRTESEASRFLRERITTLLQAVGPGPVLRPGPELAAGSLDAWLAEGLEAMTWVAEERGLGGSRSLDGLAWDLAVDAVWEAWVRRFASDLAPRLGLSAPRGEARVRLHWRGSLASMGSLAPDAALRGLGRTVWLDAKYKTHLTLLARHGWSGLGEAVRHAHRADLHQALAYANLSDAERVDTVLVYPHLATEDRPSTALATVCAGRRRVRLLLAGLPFGFRGPEHRERTLERWRRLLAA